MSHRHHPVLIGGRRRPWLLAATAVLAVILTACSDGRSAPSEPRDETGAAAPTTVTTTGSGSDAPGSTGDAAGTPTTPATVPPAPGADPEAADPVRVEIARVDIAAPVIPLGLDPAGALEVPTDFAEAGWWTGGPEPGERGPAVIAGHVDSTRGPAVFFRLAELRPGDVVTVHRADGSVAEFVVDRVEHHPKSAFPTDAVYRSTPGAELRLITCGGTFDRSTGHYVDNVVVFAHRR